MATVTRLLTVFRSGLATLDHILTVAEEHARSKGLDPDAEYPNARLIEDMLPLTFQVQNATKTVRVTLGRIEGKEYEAWEDNEKTISDLKARVQKARKLVEGTLARQEEVDKRAEEAVDLALGPNVLKTTAVESLFQHSIPNFFFHLNIAYAILRHKGVPIGKRDYILSFVQVA